MNKNLKRYLISSGVSFISAFLLTLSINLTTLDLESVGLSAIVAILFTALRAGIKAVVEYLNTKLVK